MVFVLEETDTEGFLPSARSMAFRREAWESVGGFPEHLELSEDSAFDEALLASGYSMTFRPDAVVLWTPPATFIQQARVLWAWGRSDGRAAVHTFTYLWLAKRAVVMAALTVLLALVDVRLVALAVLPLALLMWRQTRFKYRAARGPSKYLWIPLAWAVGLVARQAGFVAGWIERKRAR